MKITEIYNFPMEVDPYYKDIIPTTCEECGEELETNYELTYLKCINKSCTYRIAGQLEAIGKKIDVLGFGPVKALDIVRQYGLKNVLQPLEENIIDPDVQSYCTTLKERSYTYAEWIQLLSFENIGKKADKVFSSVNSTQELIAEFDKRPEEDPGERVTKWIESKIGGGITQEQIFYFIIENMDVLFMIDKHLKIEPAKQNVYYIALTGEIVYMDEKIKSLIDNGEFPQEAEKLLNLRWTRTMYMEVIKKVLDKTTVAFKEGPSTKAEYVVADMPSTSRKYTDGQERGKLIRSDEFFDIVLKIAKSTASSKKET